VIEVPDDPGQVAEAIAIRVGEAPRIDLIDDPVPPPIVAEARSLDDRCDPSWRQLRSPDDDAGTLVKDRRIDDWGLTGGY
jgi:hypothetical protein